MCVRIPTQEEYLEEEHAGGPDAGPTSKPGEDELADHRLDLEQQESSKKNRQREKNHAD